MSDTLFQCASCGHVCSEKQMNCDTISYSWEDNGGECFDEVWSDWICPKCGVWGQCAKDGFGPGEGWTKVEEKTPFASEISGG